LEATAEALALGLGATLRDAGFAVQVPQVGPLVGLFFSETEISNYDEARASCGSDLYGRFFTELLRRGVALAPGPYEIMFPSLAHTPHDVERTLEAAAEAAAALHP